MLAGTGGSVPAMRADGNGELSPSARAMSARKTPANQPGAEEHDERDRERDRAEGDRDRDGERRDRAADAASRRRRASAVIGRSTRVSRRAAVLAWPRARRVSIRRTACSASNVKPVGMLSMPAASRLRPQRSAPGESVVTPIFAYAGRCKDGSDGSPTDSSWSSEWRSRPARPRPAAGPACRSADAALHALQGLSRRRSGLERIRRLLPGASDRNGCVHADPARTCPGRRSGEGWE